MSDITLLALAVIALSVFGMVVSVQIARLYRRLAVLEKKISTGKGEENG